jgi:Flp pilus assembly protein protease CpaA
MIFLALALLLIASWVDLRTRIVPDWIALAMLVLGITGNAMLHPNSTVLGLAMAVAGLAVGGLIGLGLFGLAGLGGGDAKLIAALGAVLGPLALVQTLFWMAIAGAVLACCASWRGRRELAYVPAIALGLFVYCLVPNSFWSVITS